MRKFFFLFVAAGCVAACSGKPLSLEQAIDLEDVPAIQAALARGESANAVDESGETSLMFASKNGQTNIVRLLLLYAQADPNVPAQSWQTPGATALMFACQQNHADIVSLLLAAGADIEQADNTGKTPLMAASEGGHVEIVRQLLHAHAKVDAQTKDGATALMLASRAGHVSVVETLLRAGADLKKTDKQGRNAAEYARKPRLVLLLQQEEK